MSDRPELWTSGAICRHYGITRRTLQKWRARPDFPEPLLWDRNRGGVWEAAAVRAWKDARDHRGANRRAIAAERYREIGSISAVARELGVARSTVRAWISEREELKRPH